MTSLQRKVDAEGNIHTTNSNSETIKENDTKKRINDIIRYIRDNNRIADKLKYNVIYDERVVGFERTYKPLYADFSFYGFYDGYPIENNIRYNFTGVGTIYLYNEYPKLEESSGENIDKLDNYNFVFSSSFTASHSNELVATFTDYNDYREEKEVFIKLNTLYTVEHEKDENAHGGVFDGLMNEAKNQINLIEDTFKEAVYLKSGRFPGESEAGSIFNPSIHDYSQINNFEHLDTIFVSGTRAPGYIHLNPIDKTNKQMCTITRLNPVSTTNNPTPDRYSNILYDIMFFDFDKENKTVSIGRFLCRYGIQATQTSTGYVFDRPLVITSCDFVGSVPPEFQIKYTEEGITPVSPSNGLTDLTFIKRNYDFFKYL